MPIYTYRCRTCVNEFDIQQRMNEAPLSVCPACGEPQLRKVLNSVGVVFKGSGFYVTDNRNGATKSVNGSSNGKSDVVADTAAEKAKTPTPAATTDAARPNPSPEKAAPPA